MENNKQPQYFYVGQTVYHSHFGKGFVDEFDKKNNDRPMIVLFDSSYIFFTLDGRLDEDKPVSLSQNPIPEIVNQPICPFKEGDLVWVRFVGIGSFRDRWCLRFFAKFDTDNMSAPYACYAYAEFGGNSVDYWSECEPYSPETVDKYRVKE